MQTMESGNFDGHSYLISCIDNNEKKLLNQMMQKKHQHLHVHTPITSYSSLQLTYKIDIIEY